MKKQLKKTAHLKTKHQAGSFMENSLMEFIFTAINSEYKSKAFIHSSDLPIINGKSRFFVVAKLF